jgi:hypothetical protein
MSIFDVACQKEATSDRDLRAVLIAQIVLRNK